jgi:hypothetical protein
MSGGLRGETISQGGVETGTEARFDEAGNPKRVAAVLVRAAISGAD